MLPENKNKKNKLCSATYGEQTTMFTCGSRAEQKENYTSC